MATSLLSMLSQKTQCLQTRKGLIVLGLQNDFLASDGVLPVGLESGFLDRIKTTVPAFREFGDVVWVRSEYDEKQSTGSQHRSDVITRSSSKRRSSARDPKLSKKRCGPTGSNPGSGNRLPSTNEREVDAAVESSESDDEELFLTRTSQRGPACIKGSKGAEFAAQIKGIISDKDMQVVKPGYSAFSSTPLLSTLRSRLITELYVCGCNTNLSVYASAMDAARYGIKITVLADCLGYRKKDRHDLAIKRLVDLMDVRVISSAQALLELRTPKPGYEGTIDTSEEEDEDSADLIVDSDEDGDEMPIPTAVQDTGLPLSMQNLKALELQNSGAAAASTKAASQARRPSWAR